MTETAKQRGNILIMPVLVCFACMLAALLLWLHEYRQTAFVNVSGFCEILIQENPQMEVQVLSALREYQAIPEQTLSGNTFLAQYGYRSNTFYSGQERRLLMFTMTLFLVTAGSFLAAAGKLDRRSRLRIAELTEYLERVNTDVAGTIVQRVEDEFSQLWDEMYKTVTELYQTREQAVKAKMNFAENLANIAHQLKTPITAALLSLQRMEQTVPGVHAGQIKRELERLNHLEEALLTLSGLDAGTLKLEHTEVDIYTALNLAAENLSGLLEREQVSVLIPDKGCVQITGDLEWTMEAFINLMKNCMEHSPRLGVIHCDYSCNPLYAEILIWDEGEGFRPEDLPHLFERFYRGGGATGNGIGIGLALAQSILALQNGIITARNLPEGGACFEIRVYSH